MNNKLLVIINGAARSGKNTFTDFAQLELFQLNVTSKLISSVDSVKQAALLLGWDGAKDERGRSFLCLLKGISADYYDGPYLEICREFESMREEILFVMVREPAEIKKLVDTFGNQCLTVLIRRPGTNGVYNNHADENVEGWSYGYGINNIGDLEDLERSAALFARGLLPRDLCQKGPQ